MLKLDRIEPSLSPRFWSFNREPDRQSSQLVLLMDGAGEAEIRDARLVIEGPALAWLADHGAGRLRIEAGSTGFRGTIPPGFANAAVGEEASSAALRALVDHSFVLSLAGHAAPVGTMERCFEALLAEMKAPQIGSDLILSALMRVVLATALRISGGTQPADTLASGASDVLVGFRQLVEINFRNRWPVARYAQALGVTPDRLHSLCTTGTGKPPKLLVSERLAQEAALRLEQSAISIQRLGHSLGFGDQAHFSNFFRRMTGMAPSAYRQMHRRPPQPGGERPHVSFAEWP